MSPALRRSLQGHARTISGGEVKMNLYGSLLSWRSVEFSSS
jgi:hypothetical protein